MWKKFDIGDKVISKSCRYGRRVLYHKKCYENMFIEVEESLKFALIDETVKQKTAF